MTGYSAHVPFLPSTVDQATAVAGVLGRFPGARLWLGQSTTVEPHQFLAGTRVPCGTSVTLMPLRHPYEAALQARSVAALTGHPFVAGYGTGSAELQEVILGHRYRSPLTAAGNYLREVREHLTGLPSFPHPPVHLGLGVLRRGMARLAGAVADVAITWLCPPHYLREEILPALREGATSAGRPVPRLVSVVHVAQRGPGRDPVALAESVCRHHLRAPHYRDLLARAGLRPTARSLVDSGLFLTGTQSELVAGLAAYQEAGCDEVVLNLSAVGLHRGPAVALRELEMLLRKLAVASAG